MIVSANSESDLVIQVARLICCRSRGCLDLMKAARGPARALPRVWGLDLMKAARGSARALPRVWGLDLMKATCEPACALPSADYLQPFNTRGKHRGAGHGMMNPRSSGSRV